MHFSSEYIQQVKDANDIVDVVSEYVELKRAGGVLEEVSFPSGRYAFIQGVSAQPKFLLLGGGKGSRNNGTALM